MDERAEGAGIGLAVDAAVAYFGWRLLGSMAPEEGRAWMKKLYLAMTGFVVAFIAVILVW